MSHYAKFYPNPPIPIDGHNFILLYHFQVILYVGKFYQV